jgi:hypothetical protein
MEFSRLACLNYDLGKIIHERYEAGRGFQLVTLVHVTSLAATTVMDGNERRLIGIRETWSFIFPPCETLMTPRAESISITQFSTRVIRGILLYGAPFWWFIVSARSNAILRFFSLFIAAPNSKFARSIS